MSDIEVYVGEPIIEVTVAEPLALTVVLESTPIVAVVAPAGGPGPPGPPGPPGSEIPIVTVPNDQWPPASPEAETLYLRMAP